ncbi:MAG: ferrous iron transport protein B [Clostridia bacterium]|nr:ferrous iron transport protein B [Clostridia bacterium]
MRIALIGNQNSGKTTLFNLLTGMQQKIGNWPGVTVEKKSGVIKGTSYELVDLPGIYSFSPYTIEEKISQEFVLHEKMDLIINVVDASNLERSLYLTTQLLELDCPVIVALNMIDVANKKGMVIHDLALEKQLGAEVCRISAKNGMGIHNLIQYISHARNHKKIRIFDDYLEAKIDAIERTYLHHENNKRFVAIRLLEGKESKKEINLSQDRDEIEKKYHLEMAELIATQRYDFLDRILKDVVQYQKRRRTLTDYLDKLFLNQYIGMLFFAVIMFLVYYLSVGVVGDHSTSIVAASVNIFKGMLQNIFVKMQVSEMLTSLVLEGIVAGVGTVLSFVPQLVMLFLCISVLESTGYLSRVSMLFDHLFRKIGLSGKSIIPFIVGSGCSVPGIMASRMIESEEERDRTIICTPFIPCSAKLPIIALFAGCFFKEYAGVASATVYFLAIVIIIVSSYFMVRGRTMKNDITYISELPEYKLPSVKYVFRDVLDKVISFLKRAGSVILICSVVLWFLLTFSVGFEYGVDVENSILAMIGKKISFLFYPMIGKNSWEATVSIMQGIVAKEQVISSMAIISGLKSGAGSAAMFEQGGVFDFFTASSALAFVTFNLFSAPCISAIATMRKELGTNGKLVKALMFQTAVAYVVSVVIYQVGSRFGV